MNAGTALVTGASSGIGRELARVFAANGHDLVLVARRRDRLRALAAELERDHGVGVTVLVQDLEKPRAAGALFRAVERRGIDVDVLVNNAGIMANGDFVDIPLARHLAVVGLNVLVPTELAYLFLRPMLERGWGRILNVGSMAGFQALPRLSVYAATKAYALHLTEALSEELRGTGVSATALCPGFTDTEVLSQAPDVRGLPSFAIGSAEAVARDGYRACMEGIPVYVSGLGNQLATQLIHYQPRWLRRTLGGMFARRNK